MFVVAYLEGAVVEFLLYSNGSQLLLSRTSGTRCIDLLNLASYGLDIMQELVQDAVHSSVLPDQAIVAKKPARGQRRELIERGGRPWRRSLTSLDACRGAHQAR